MPSPCFYHALTIRLPCSYQARAPPPGGRLRHGLAPRLGNAHTTVLPWRYHAPTMPPLRQTITQSLTQFLMYSPCNPSCNQLSWGSGASQMTADIPSHATHARGARGGEADHGYSARFRNPRRPRATHRVGILHGKHGASCGCPADNDVRRTIRHAPRSEAAIQTRNRTIQYRVLDAYPKAALRIHAVGRPTAMRHAAMAQSRRVIEQLTNFKPASSRLLTGS